VPAKLRSHSAAHTACGPSAIAVPGRRLEAADQQHAPRFRIDVGQTRRKIYFPLGRRISIHFTYNIVMDDNSLRTTAFTIEKQNEGWFVILPDRSMLGPYLNGDVVLEVAVTHALLARGEGLDAHIFVRDERGGSHKCIVLDYMNDPHRCQKCESTWTAGGLPVKCHLRTAISRL
jgi:hypothetical protein